MMLQLAAVLPLLATVAVAANTPVVSCRTEMGSKSVGRLPTTTYTSTDRVRPTTTLTFQKTVTSYTPYFYTITKLTTQTDTETDTDITGTYTSTSVFYEVRTDTAASTITTTSTSTATTSTTSTTIIPTTAGFKNIQDTLNSYDLPRRRELSHPHAGPAPEKRAVKQGVLALAAYPTKVACTKILPNTNKKTVSTTLAPATRWIPYYAGKKTTTDTITSTSTVVENVEATETSTSTSSVMTTVTTMTTQTDTATVTSTQTLSGPTSWDACLPQNTFGPTFHVGSTKYYATNVANNGFGVGSDFKAVADGAGSAQECCEACQRFGTCETFIFRARNRNCFILYHEGATCPSQANHPNYILSKAGTDPGTGYTVGNGNCGYTYSGNSDSSLFQVPLPQ